MPPLPWHSRQSLQASILHLCRNADALSCILPEEDEDAGFGKDDDDAADAGFNDEENDADDAVGFGFGDV